MLKMLIVALLLAPATCFAWDKDDAAFYGRWNQSSDPYRQDPTMSSAGPYRAGERYITTDRYGRTTHDVEIRQIWNDDPDYGSRIKTYDRTTGEYQTIRIKPPQ